MGYRSDVTIRCSRGVYDKLYATWTEHELYPDRVFVEQYSNEQAYVIQWDYIKWYDGYEQIDAINAVLRECVAIEDPELKFGFLRIGEDPDDVERITTDDYQYEVYLIREAEIDSGAKKLDESSWNLDIEEPEFDDDEINSIV